MLSKKWGIILLISLLGIFIYGMSWAQGGTCLTIEKQIEGPSGSIIPVPFGFSTAVNLGGTPLSPDNFTLVIPGTPVQGYDTGNCNSGGTVSITENMYPNWELLSATCTSGGEPYPSTLDGNTLTLEIPAATAPAIICTFVDARRPFTNVPAMNQWGMAGLIVLSGLGGVWYLRRQRRTEN